MLAVDYSRGERLCSTICRKNQCYKKYLERSEKLGLRLRGIFEGFVKLELEIGQNALVYWTREAHKLRIKNLEQSIMVKPGLVSRFWSTEHP